MSRIDELPFLAGHPALDFVNTLDDRAGEAPIETLRRADDLRTWGRRQGLLDDATAGRSGGRGATADGGATADHAPAPDGGATPDRPTSGATSSGATPGATSSGGTSSGGTSSGGERPGDADVAALAAAVALREQLHELFDARLAGRPAPPPARDALARAVAEAHAAGSLAEDDAGRLRWRWDRHDPDSVRHAVAHAAAELLAGPLARLRRCPGDDCGWLFLDETKAGNRRWCSMRACGQVAKSASRRSATRAPTPRR